MKKWSLNFTRLVFLLGVNLMSSCDKELAEEIEAVAATELVPTITKVSPESGFCQTQITITGTNFSNILAENTVKFNGVSSAVLQATTTSLIVNIPPGASTGPLTVTVGSKVATGPTVNVPNPFSLKTIKSRETNILDQPGGITIDEAGDIYISDKTYHSVSKITQEGVITRLAGTGNQNFGGYGSTDGPVATAKLAFPGGLVIDAARNIYVADATVGSSGRVRKISNDGQVTTLATDLKGIRALALDNSGNLYVGEGRSGGKLIIKKISAPGEITTFYEASNGYVNGLSVDGSGNVYVADLASNSIIKISKDGVAGTFFSIADLQKINSGFVNATNGEFFEVAVDSKGNVYTSGEYTYSNTDNYFILKITPTGDASLLAFSSVNSSDSATLGNGCTIALLGRPGGIAIDNKSGKVFLIAGEGISRLDY